MTAARRIAVVGPTGSGKTALAVELSTGSRLPCIHLDGLRYRDDWNPAPDDKLRDQVADIVGTAAWIIEGNYAAVRDLMWENADLVVWLDMPRSVTLPRLIRRTLRRIFSRHHEPGAPRESWRRVFGAQSVVLWALRTHTPLRHEYERSTELYSARGTVVVRLRTPAAASDWISSIHYECSPATGIQFDQPISR